MGTICTNLLLHECKTTTKVKQTKKRIVVRCYDVTGCVRGLILVKLQALKLQALPSALLKLTSLHGCFSRFLNWTKSIKLQKASHFIYVNLH